MYIRKRPYKTKNGEARYSYGLVECRREAGMPKQRTILNLGRDFDVDPQDWPALCAQTQALLIGKPMLPMHGEDLEGAIRDLASRLTAIGYDPRAPRDDRDTVILREMEQVDARTVGGERTALAALSQLGFTDLLKALKLSERQIKLACALVVGRMLAPGSERHTHRWLHTRSALMELLQLSPCSPSTLYRVGDRLWAHHDKITGRLFANTQSLLDLDETRVLYDLTHTCTYGKAREKKQFGRSKEKRSGCRRVTLALTLDASGFPRAAEVLPGNVSEPRTLKAAIARLNGSRPTIIMDAGIATAANLKVLREKNLPYLCVSRAKTPPAPERAPDHVLHTGSGVAVEAWRLERTASRVTVYMRSAARKHVSDSLLETSHTDWKLEEMVRTYWQLTDIERTFRTMKTSLGLRPLHHQPDARIEAHIFISLLAYHAVQLIRTRLKTTGLHDSWATLRDELGRWMRITTLVPTSRQEGILVTQDRKPTPLWEQIAKTMNVPMHRYTTRATTALPQNP